jgi:uncharacterized 2Fe-2S/4Fe-4S cluster protein (DUF4445 family)
MTNIVRFTLEGAEGRILDAPFVEGQSVLDAAKTAGLAIDAPCGGNGTCGKCRVKTAAQGGAEAWTLACQTKAAAGMEVFVPLAARSFKNAQRITALSGGRENAAFAAMRSALAALGLAGDSGISRVELTLSPPPSTIPDPTASACLTLTARKQGLTPSSR